MKHGKKYIEAAKNIERGNLYGKEEGIALVKKTADSWSSCTATRNW